MEKIACGSSDPTWTVQLREEGEEEIILKIYFITIKKLNENISIFFNIINN